MREHSLFWVKTRSKCTDNQINVIITRRGGESHCNSSLWQFTVLHKTIKTYSIQSKSSHPTLVPEPQNIEIFTTKITIPSHENFFNFVQYQSTLCNKFHVTLVVIEFTYLSDLLWTVYFYMTDTNLANNTHRIDFTHHTKFKQLCERFTVFV